MESVTDANHFMPSIKEEKIELNNENERDPQIPVKISHFLN